jgi:multiple sugar transport system substrate-binding protein
MKSLSRRLSAATAVLALAAGSATAAEVRVVVAWYSEATPEIFQGMAEDFMSANPDVTVTVEDVSWDNLQQRLTTDIAGGTAPDIAIIGTRWLVDYVANDIAEPLDGCVTDEVRGRFIETFLEPSVIDGVTYGLPVAASARAMYYDIDLLAEVGYDEPPQTWDEVVEVATALRDAGHYGFGLQGKEIETDAYWYYALWTHGGELFEDGQSAIDSEAAIEAATLYKTMIDEGLTQPDPTGFNRQDVEALLKQGRVGMILSGPWLRGQMAEEAPDVNYGIAPVPMATEQATYGVTDSIMMFATSEVKDEACRFLTEAAFTDEWRREFTVREGFLPVFQSVAADPAFADDPQLKAFTDMLPYARFAPLVPDWELMADTTSAALQNIYLGNAEPETALQEAAARIDELLQ